MRMIVVVALLAGCAPTPSGTAGARPGAYTPIGDVAGPSGGISKRCVQLSNGLAAECRPL